MTKWAFILLIACQCFAGTTNWLAQRPSLVSDYGNYFPADSVPLSLTGNLIGWWPFPANFGATQYCFGTACTNDLTVSGATWSNNYGGEFHFDGVNDRIWNVSTNYDFTDASSFTVAFRIRFFAALAEINVRQNPIYGRRTAESILKGWGINYFYYLAPPQYMGHVIALQHWGGREYQLRGIPPITNWTHYVYAHGNSVCEIYMNGIRQAVYTNGSGSTAQGGLSTNSIGAIVGNFANSTIADFKIFDRQLSSNEVWELSR